jgi:II/X family phage/plasmid replication protein
LIDWLTFVAPLTHRVGEGGPFFGGEVLSTIPDPTHSDGVALEWGILKRVSLEGSYSKRIEVRSVLTDSGGPGLWVSGNPAKWFQGHNIFGSDDLAGLVREMLVRICASRGVQPSADDLSAWDAGQIKLLRVDVTRSWNLGSLARVRAALRGLDVSARLKHRGRGHYRGDSLTFGEKSRRWSLTAYAKGAEIALGGKHALPLDLAQSSLPAVADGLLRLEVRMLAMELTEQGLDTVAAWEDFTAVELHARMLSGLEIADATMLDAPTLQGLPGRLQLAYEAWKAGHDLRETLSRPTFYRYRSELLKHGIDIGVKQERPAESNVVPLRVVLNAYPAGVPDWAHGTSLYFEPRFRAA